MNNAKRCWSCGKGTMVNQGKYSQCSECGATWNEVPVFSFGGLVIEPIAKNAPATKYRPYRRKVSRR